MVSTGRLAQLAAAAMLTVLVGAAAPNMATAAATGDQQAQSGDRDLTRTAALYVPFVLLGPRVAHPRFGHGWCRALHRGRHWAPGAGWHAGKHVGRVPC